MTTTKSPRKVMAEALAAAASCLPAHAHRFAPRKFTQPQLFACLALKEFERKDYRGVCQLLADCRDLRDAIGLAAVPHYTTLQKAARRLPGLAGARALLAATVGRVLGRRATVDHAAADSSGFDARHASRYFVRRRDGDTGKGADRPKKRSATRRSAS